MGDNYSVQTKKNSSKVKAVTVLQTASSVFQTSACGFKISGKVNLRAEIGKVAKQG
jgi:hypothetical protein